MLKSELLVEWMIGLAGLHQSAVNLRIMIVSFCWFMNNVNSSLELISNIAVGSLL